MFFVLQVFAVGSDNREDIADVFMNREKINLIEIFILPNKQKIYIFKNDFFEVNTPMIKCINGVLPQRGVIRL